MNYSYLNKDSVSVTFENGITKAYMNTLKGRMELQAETSKEVYNEIVSFWEANGGVQEEPENTFIDSTQEITKMELKLELEKIVEDIEQVDLFGMVREDIDLKRARAAEIVNELRVLEGKEPREVQG